MRHAGIAALVLLGFAPAGGEDERGLALFRQGEYAEAASAFRAAIEAEGPSAERSYNLALALWKAGQADEAETAAEQAATLSDGEFNPLRDGLLGNVRYAAARKVEAEDLRAALGLAEQARAHYLRGAVALDGRPELARNLERALRLIEELKKKIEEQEEQQDEDEEGDQEQNEDQQDGEDGKSDEKQEQDQKGDGEQPSEPQQSDEPQPEDQQDQKSEGEQEEQPPAPGEQLEGRQLTPEEKKRLLDKLDELEEMRIELRKLQKAARPKVKRDW